MNCICVPNVPDLHRQNTLHNNLLSLCSDHYWSLMIMCGIFLLVSSCLYSRKLVFVTFGFSDYIALVSCFVSLTKYPDKKATHECFRVPGYWFIIVGKWRQQELDVVCCITYTVWNTEECSYACYSVHFVCSYTAQDTDLIQHGHLQTWIPPDHCVMS